MTGLKDIGYVLRVAYIAKLSPVNYFGLDVPIYDGIVPEDAPDYFVVIKDQNEADKSLKCGFNTDVHLTLDIVTRFPAGSGSSMIADNLSGQINELICPRNSRDLINLLPDFNVMNSVRTLSRVIIEPSKEVNIFRKINVYRHEIQQLT
jgi:hypothetical protein